MASIRDVAKKAGVAACTVSRVLNQSGYVAPETRIRIEEAMKELNYIPNELARGMFRQKAGIVAMLVPNIRHPFFSSLAGSIEKELYKKGYKLMLCSTDDNLEREQEYMNIFKSNIVDGVIMGVNSLDDNIYIEFGKPLIMLDYQVDNNIPVIVSDHRQGGEFAAQQFIKSQCKNIIHICGESNKAVLSFLAHQTLQKELEKANIQNRAVTIKWNTFDFNGYLELAKTILEEYPQIDGIMAADMPCIAFLKAAIQLGRKIPQDFCAVSYDGTYVINMNILDITTIVQPISRIAQETIQTMELLIEGKRPKDSKTELEVSLKLGQTTK